jgi:hypothetical protein
MSPKR